jgi:cyclic 2,3-diphosphoglycerate synthetase
LRTLVLVDGEHYPPVVAAAISQLPSRFPGARPVGIALLGGAEKLPAGGVTGDDGDAPWDLPVVTGATPDEALLAGLDRFSPELVVDLSDEPVLDARVRLRLVARALAAGVAYRVADARFDPPPRPRLATKPSVAVIGTGKRTGKTAVSVHAARTLAGRGTPPVIVAMGRGGPAEPELVDPRTFDLRAEALVALADTGRHAASDHLEDALLAGVVTVGTRRCGGGMAGMPGDSTFAAGVALANTRPESLLLFEGSGQAIPPVHADATVCVVPAGADVELVTGYLGSYRLLLTDLVVVSMAEASLADPGAVTALERSVRGVAPGAGVVRTIFRPTPLEPISGRRVLYATTAAASVTSLLAEHLEREHGCTVVGVSPHLAERARLARDLEVAADVDVLVVELKAAGIDVAARVALERGIDVVFCDNRVVTVGGDGEFEEMVTALADLATSRFTTTRPTGCQPTA